MPLPSLLGLTPDELSALCVAAGAKPFVGRQVAQWLYTKAAPALDAMTNVPARVRTALADTHEVGRRAHRLVQESADGTRKYLFPTATGHTVETVYIPDGARATLCVSCQVGCKMGCAFCMTGRQGYEASLSAGDILNQVMSLPERERLTNIVFMGQGEPLDNLDNVLRAAEVLTAPWGLGWSPRRITISTVGLRSGLQRLVDECKCHVAVSLHNPFADERAALMPAERAYPVREIVDALQTAWGRTTPGRDMQRRLSFEYIVFGGVNDTPRHARALASLLSRLDCRVNLIRFHAIPGSPLRSPSEADVLRLRDYLTQHGVYTTVRASRGEDIRAACGLLNTEARNL
ncbi:MAG: 23S rRNA (adenine(2503)-C(2))-methyltransferase RlmN [Bacteroidaceae bacterium]|nr:23S rRNA (adenine(2503)-C(2))-methyltransferase RlmN [Bacteroidaceae bacterium]